MTWRLINADGTLGALVTAVGNGDGTITLTGASLELV